MGSKPIFNSIGCGLSWRRKIWCEARRERRFIADISDHEGFASSPAILPIEEAPNTLAAIEGLALDGVYDLGFGDQREPARSICQVNGEIGPLFQMRSIEAEAFLASDDARNELPPQRFFVNHGIETGFQKGGEFRFIAPRYRAWHVEADILEGLRHPLGEDLQMKIVDCR
ncbi:hypothetical protein QWE_03140 [Agrobacterium albertimagni AOL15]|uniref:Uncharacterized protein n=1 Tax=Agrobacterium albertimagni AOL15 TaxID=1156935 RepID=K2QK09_9HYPH|nr:hypothetical protein [Agrobacterium albertimagni]EKF61531.1 hypothetical protein QWE_03140 [Agrobacterium albertimagni AOL15]